MSLKILSKSKLIIGTRGSTLALWQSNHIAGLLKKKFPGLAIEIINIKTTGDKILDAPLSKIGDKGLFTKELDTALINKEADIAVHSLKDIPTQIPDELTIAAICEREDVRDIFIPHPDRPGLTLKNIPQGGTVATGSLRRRSQLLNFRPDLEIAEIRGNLDTRINKLKESEWSGMLLAYAGVARLGLKNIIGEIISPSIVLPAVGQGAIGIMTRKEDGAIIKLLESINHQPTWIATLAERALLRRLEGGCQIPIGAHGIIVGNHLTIHAMVGDLQGIRVVRDRISGDADKYEKLGIELAERLISKGAGKILDEIRKISGQ
jgi:hydroxymethylbilane synthase